MNTAIIHLSDHVRERLAFGILLVAAGLAAFFGIRAHHYTAHLEAVSDETQFRQDVIWATQDTILYPLAAVDNHRNIMIWNVAMEKLTGYTKEEIQELGLEIIIADEAEAKRHVAAMTLALTSKDRIGKVTVTRSNIRTKKGEIIPVRVSVYVYPSRTDGLFALARISRESSVTEVDAMEARK